MANPPTHSDEKSTKEVLDELSINTCCDDACIDCIIDGACHTESGCRDDCGGPHGNPVFTRCDGDDCEPPCPRECWSCGPLQIKEEYWEDAQWHCGFNSSSPCCELQNYDWEQTFCNGGVSCEEQKRLSKLAMMCYWRKYTRNGSCQCEGNCPCEDGPNTDCPNTCYSCEDLIRMHNGGMNWCNAGPGGTGTMDRHIRRTCGFLCSESSECAACMDCECDDGPIIQVEKKTARSMDPPRGGACCIDGICNDGYTKVFCRNSGGVYYGDETLCEDYPQCENDYTDCASDIQCPIGLCCENGLCVPCARVGGRAWR